MGRANAGSSTHNASLALGPHTLLEILAPDPDQPSPAQPRPFGIDDLTSPRLVGWAVACDDIDAAITASRTAGYDPGEAIELTSPAPDGTVLRRRITRNALGGGPVPFLISWGDTEHPASSAPQALRLAAFEIEHPDPQSLASTLHALRADVDVRPAETIALVARIHGPRGSEELR